MPMNQTIFLARYQDGTLTVDLTPPTNITNWALRFEMMNHFGGVSGIVTKSAASGFNNVSGINVTNATGGIFNVNFQSTDTSGLEYGAYAYTIERMDSGSRTTLVEGYVNVGPTAGP